METYTWKPMYPLMSAKEGWATVPYTSGGLEWRRNLGVYGAHSGPGVNTSRQHSSGGVLVYTGAWGSAGSNYAKSLRSSVNADGKTGTSAHSNYTDCQTDITGYADYTDSGISRSADKKCKCIFKSKGKIWVLVTVLRAIESWTWSCQYIQCFLILWRN